MEKAIVVSFILLRKAEAECHPAFLSGGLVCMAQWNTIIPTMFN
jgi:hypothetical protein